MYGFCVSNIHLFFCFDNKRLNDFRGYFFVELQNSSRQCKWSNEKTSRHFRVFAGLCLIKDACILIVVALAEVRDREKKRQIEDTQRERETERERDSDRER